MLMWPPFSSTVAHCLVIKHRFDYACSQTPLPDWATLSATVLKKHYIVLIDTYIHAYIKCTHIYINSCILNVCMQAFILAYIPLMFISGHNVHSLCGHVYCLLCLEILLQVYQSVRLRTLMPVSIQPALLFRCNVTLRNTEFLWWIHFQRCLLIGTLEACFNNPFLVWNLCDYDSFAVILTFDLIPFFHWYLYIVYTTALQVAYTCMLRKVVFVKFRYYSEQSAIAYVYKMSDKTKAVFVV